MRPLQFSTAAVRINNRFKATDFFKAAMVTTVAAFSYALSSNPCFNIACAGEFTLLRGRVAALFGCVANRPYKSLN